jgi:hypothetical protein
MSIKRALKKFGSAVASVGNRLEDRNDRRAAEIVSAILAKADDEDVLTALIEDAVDGIADKYELVIPEIRVRIERKGGKHPKWKGNKP